MKFKIIKTTVDAIMMCGVFPIKYIYKLSIKSYKAYRVILLTTDG